MLASRYVEHASTSRRSNKHNEQKGYGLRMYMYHLYIQFESISFLIVS